jgi:hypothetical protein
MADRLSFSPIPSLKGSENYSPWSRAIQALLLSQDLWSYVQGSKANLPNNDQEAWKAQTKRIVGIIAMNVAPELQGMVLECETAADAMKKLQDNFDPSKTPTQYSLLHDLFHIELRSEDLTNYFFLELMISF